MRSGPHAVKWDGLNEVGASVTSGVYFVRLEAGRLISRKVVLMK